MLSKIKCDILKICGFMKNIKLYNLFYIFIIGSVLGWLIEGIFTFIKKGILINHSALVIGPFNIVYGIGACVLTILLIKYKNAPLWKIFLLSFIGGSILEYILSFGMELILGFTAWNYSHKILNLNGRICLLYSIYWGILGIAWIKLAYPFIDKLIRKINVNFGKKLIVFLSIFLMADLLFTFSAIERAREKDVGIPPSNNYEKFLDNTFNTKYLKNMFNNRWK